MKHITLANVTLDDGEPFSYRQQLINVAKNPVLTPNQQGELVSAGIDADEMDKRLRLLKVLRDCEDGEVAAFEDADHALLRDLVNRTRWGMASEGLMTFIRAVREGADSLPQITAPANAVSLNGLMEEAIGQAIAEMER